jgi:hypothetical protein
MGCERRPDPRARLPRHEERSHTQRPVSNFMPRTCSRISEGNASAQVQSCATSSTSCSPFASHNIPVQSPHTCQLGAHLLRPRCTFRREPINCFNVIWSGWETGDCVQSQYDADYWRQCADEARAVARAMTHPAPKREMLFIAQAYERLADRAELTAGLRGNRSNGDAAVFLACSRWRPTH